MRILIASNFYPPSFIGGAELIAHDQAKALASHGHDVQVFAGAMVDRPPRYGLAQDTYGGLLVHRVSLFRDDYSPARINFFHPPVEAQFAALLESFRPDVVHFHNLAGLSAALIGVARSFGARTAVTLHDHWGFCFKNTAMRTDSDACIDFSACAECMATIVDRAGHALPSRLRKDFIRACLHAADALISPSEYLADAYLAAGFPGRTMHVVWNGIDVARFARIRRRPGGPAIRFTYAGVLAPHKGVPTLLQAAASLDPARARINIVGDGDPAGLKLMAGALGLRNVRFWGKVPHDAIEEVYRETDVLVLPSIWRENQPVTITEALASGIPVIASRVGGNPELVEHGVTGLLFEAGEPDDLAVQMSRFLDGPELVARFGDAGRLRMQDNTFERQTAKLLRLYDRIQRTPTPPDSLPPVIACVGAEFDPVALEALDLLADYAPEQNPLVVGGDWPLPRDVRPTAALVVDPAVSDATPWVDLGVPLVVPSNGALADECRRNRSGISFADADEAAAALAELLRMASARSAAVRRAS